MLDKEIYKNIIEEVNINPKLARLKAEFIAALAVKNFSSAACFRKLSFFGGPDELTINRFSKVTEVYDNFSKIIHKVLKDITNNHAYNLYNNSYFTSYRSNIIKKINEIIIQPKIGYFNSEKEKITNQESKKNSIKTVNDIKQLDIQNLNVDEVEEYLNSILLTFRNLVINYALDTRNEREEWVSQELGAIKNSLDSTIELIVCNVLIKAQEFNLRSKETLVCGAVGATSDVVSKGDEGNGGDVGGGFLDEENQERVQLIHLDQSTSSKVLPWLENVPVTPSNLENFSRSHSSFSGIVIAESTYSESTLYTDITSSTNQTIGAIQLGRIKENLLNSQVITKFSEETADLLIEMMNSSIIEEKKEAKDLIEKIAKNIDKKCARGVGFSRLCKENTCIYDIYLKNIEAKKTSRLKHRV